MIMKRRDGKTKVNIVEHIILSNFWEYYITDEPTCDPHIKFCYVYSNDQDAEFGDVDMTEIAPYIITRTTRIGPDIMPAPGFIWQPKSLD